MTPFRDLIDYFGFAIGKEVPLCDVRKKLGLFVRPPTTVADELLFRVGSIHDRLSH